MRILKFINIIKLAVIHKKKTCKISYHKIYLNFLNKLIDVNLIKSYRIVKNTIYINFIKVDGDLIYGTLTNFYKPRNCKSISIQFLKKNLKNFKKGLYFIMTSYGLKTHLDSIKENKSGFLLFKLSR